MEVVAFGPSDGGDVTSDVVDCTNVMNDVDDDNHTDTRSSSDVTVLLIP